MGRIPRVALITGITGQDGSYLAEYLLEIGYDVWGVIRRSSQPNTQRIDHIFDKLKLRYGDLNDTTSIVAILNEIRNTYEVTRLELYNLAAQSHVKISFELPEYTCDVDALGTLRLLDAVRICNLSWNARIYQASSSEMFGKVQAIPQSETTPFYPRSPYGVSKLFSYWIMKNYRESYDMFCCNGILFNHESPRRGHNFVTRKITMGLGKILRGESDRLVMGNIDALRDWGHAKDYVKGMWMMLQENKPDDYVLATGEQHSVREFIEKAFALKGFDIKWKGEGVNEIGYDEKTGRELIFIDKKYYRPAEVDTLLGDSTKAKQKLNWKCDYSFDDLVKEMVEMDSHS
jgi:GDPmannose 4,6-dehydratase